MAKRLPEITKSVIASRLGNGEEASALAKEFGVSEFSVKEWGREFKPKKRRVKRKVAIKQPNPQNTRVSSLEKENAELRMELEVWKGAYKAITSSK